MSAATQELIETHSKELKRLAIPHIQEIFEKVKNGSHSEHELSTLQQAINGFFIDFEHHIRGTP